MAIVYLLFLFTIVLILSGLRHAALILGVVALLGALGIFWYHLTSTVNIIL